MAQLRGVSIENANFLLSIIGISNTFGKKRRDKVLNNEDFPNKVFSCFENPSNHDPWNSRSVEFTIRQISVFTEFMICQIRFPTNLRFY